MVKQHQQGGTVIGLPENDETTINEPLNPPYVNAGWHFRIAVVP
jgi:hypothetical protein